MEKSVKTQLLGLSIIKELESRTKEVDQQRCWLDGSSCPYGNPEGKFELRPRNFCYRGVCSKISPNVGREIAQLLCGNLVSDWCSENESITLSKTLTNIIGDESCELDGDSKTLIKAVAEILENAGELNLKIYHAEDLEDSI